MSTNLLEKITNNGVYIFTANPDRAEQLIAIVNDFPNLQEDTGTINIPELEIIKVLLVEGWQKYNVSSRAYLLSKKDRQVLDETFDKLYAKNKMEQVIELTPFAHPVFVVWQIVYGVQKGQVVIDLRLLNRVAVPDNYPLLL